MTGCCAPSSRGSYIKYASPSNNNTRYWQLTVIDVFSKFLWVRPLRDKTADRVKNALEDIIQSLGGSLPRLVQSDNGAEFLGGLQDYLSDEDIKQVFSRPYRPTTQAHVERVNGTIKARVARHMEEHDTKTYLPVLQDLVDSYNNTVHGTTKLTPQQAFHDQNTRGWVKERVEKQALASTKGRRMLPLRVGDKVRVAERTRDEIRRELSQLGRRSLLPQWSRAIYTIKNVSQPRDKPGRPANLEFQLVTSFLHLSPSP